MAEPPREKQKPSLGKWKSLGSGAFEVTALSRQRALEVGSKLLDAPYEELQVKAIRERQRYLGSQTGRKVSRRYRVSLKPIDGTFLLSIDGNAVFLQVEPARNGGRSVVVDQVLQDLDRWPVSAVDNATIQKAIDKTDGSRMLVARLTTPEDAPKHGVAILVTEDQMRAYALARGKAVSSPVDREALEQAFAAAGVVAGVLEDEVNAYVPARNRERPVLLARGLEPVAGEAAAPAWLVPVAPGPGGKPVPAVDPGQPLARIKPASTGRTGLTVTGRAVAATAGGSRALAEFAGPGVVVSSDGELLLAATRGKPALQGEQVVVLKVETVEAVAGSHEADGSLAVAGPVASGSQIRATGHVEIEEAVQDATIRAGGSIVVEGGVSGKSLLTAGQDVLTRFLRGSVVKAGGAVRVGSEIVQGTVLAGQRVLVAGRGRIDGGLVRAGQEIVADTIGNEDGRTTRVVVGGEPGDKPARIVAWRRVLPGTIVRIGQAELEIDEPLGPTVFELEQGKVVGRPLSGQRPAED